MLTGFLENGTIPVNFPKDICLFEVNGVIYASALHFSNHPHNLVNQSIRLTIYKSAEVGNYFQELFLVDCIDNKRDRLQSGEFAEIFTYKTESALDMDCISYDGIGFVVVSNTIEHDIENFDEGSPVFRVTPDKVQIVQYFSKPFQNKIYLRSETLSPYLHTGVLTSYVLHQFTDFMAIVCS